MPEKVYVAARDASDVEKARARYWCDGVDDQFEMQTGIDSATYEVDFQGGHYIISRPLVVDSNRSLFIHDAFIHLSDDFTIGWRPEWRPNPLQDYSGLYPWPPPRLPDDAVTPA